MVLHGHTPEERKKLLGRTAGRLGSLSTKLTGKARATSVNKGKQGALKRRSVDRTLQLRTGRGEPKSLLSSLKRGKMRKMLSGKRASSISRRPASGTVDRTLQLRRDKKKRLGQLGITRTR